MLSGRMSSPLPEAAELLFEVEFECFQRLTCIGANRCINADESVGRHFRALKLIVAIS